MDEIEQLRTEIKKVRNLARWVFGLTLLAFLILALVGGCVLYVAASKDPLSISQQANPIISTTISAPDQLSALEDRAETRGYYYKTEFAEKMGVSEKTIDRWREAGKIPATLDEDGRVAIPLDAILGK
jgi:hypothetical protein